MSELTLVAHVASTLALVGLIWTVQVDLYPLFAQVGREVFVDYHASHSARITIVVLPLMAIEFLTGMVLAFVPPVGFARLPFLLGFAGVLLLWASTFFVQVPLHGSLGRGFSPELQRKLVRTNWFRTFIWTARGGFLLWVMYSLLPSTA